MRESPDSREGREGREGKDTIRMVEKALRQLRPPAAPGALRERALDAARRALQEEEKPDTWTRLWESRPLRIAWSVAALLLLAMHAALPLRPAPAVARRPSPAQDGEIRRIAQLPPIDADAIPHVEPRPVRKETRS